MNWVGGSRSRMIFKQERQKQREFFQKKKMKSQLKLLESSHPGKASLSLDLLNLHVINQISKKKEGSNPPQHADMCKRKKTFSDVGRIAQLPMSPITVPSKICLDDSETILSQAAKVKCRTEENLQNCITKQELKNEETFNTTTEAKSRNYFHNESNENHSRPELEPGFQLCLYDKCASDNNVVASSADIIEDNKVKLPLQCSASHSTKLTLFEMQGDLSPNVSKLTGKRDVSVQCSLEWEPTFMGYFRNNGI